MTLNELADAASLVEAGLPLPPALDAALVHASSIGGARPKSGIVDGDRHLIAKFASRTDTTPVVQYEYVAMTLAARAGLDVAPVELVDVGGRQVLLVERFERPGDGRRLATVSALTILQLDEWSYAHSSCADLADEIRARFTNPTGTLRELYSRIVFNILVSNFDDHARNHAAFWDGRSEQLTLTPAYDICPQPRAGSVAKQAMAIGPSSGGGVGDRDARLRIAIDHAGHYLLETEEARAIIASQVELISDQFDDVCADARLNDAARNRLRSHQILPSYAFDGYEP